MLDALQQIRFFYLQVMLAYSVVPQQLQGQFGFILSCYAHSS